MGKQSSMNRKSHLDPDRCKNTNTYIPFIHLHTKSYLCKYTCNKSTVLGVICDKNTKECPAQASLLNTEKMQKLAKKINAPPSEKKWSYFEKIPVTFILLKWLAETYYSKINGAKKDLQFIFLETHVLS